MTVRGSEGIYWVEVDGGWKLATLNLSPGRTVYGERLVRVGEEEYRLWDPFRSKLAASILKGLRRIPIRPGARVLYLGAASGTTASHVSDIVGSRGIVYCVDFAPRAVRDLIGVCAERSNMLPLLADARFPERYHGMIELVDVIYCDLAQPDQARILADNADLFLREGGWGMIAIKAKSIDVTKEPSEIYGREIDLLKERGFEVAEVVYLEPYERDHAMVVATYRRSV